ncbi:MAG TPA: SgcJ/EcaC family oxidoreductase [Actinomycetota bacterium]|nr:SgcJ/EcaC family oxidoreductase [Actinomycetota bacterium]
MHDAVRVYEQLLNAWNNHDAEGFAALFADDGNVVGFDGSSMNGREEIAAELGRIFADHQTASYVAKLREVREVAPPLVLIRAVVGMVPTGRSGINPETNSIQHLLLSKQGGHFKIEVFQNTPAAYHGRPDLAEALTQELTEVLQADRGVVAGEG